MDQTIDYDEESGGLMLPVASKPKNTTNPDSPTFAPAVAPAAPPPPPPGKMKSTLSLNPMDLLYMISGKRKRAPTSKEVAAEIAKLEKLTEKMAGQQKRVNDVLRDWGAELPEPESRELMSNMHNLFSGPLVIYNELQSRLSTIHSNFADLIRMEDHNARVESELKATQKLYYKANYRDFPPYQIDSYQASYESICAEIDELHLRHRNRLVFMIKQSYQLILQQMLDCHQMQKVCAETGIRFLSGFDAEPRDVLPEGYTAYSTTYSAASSAALSAEGEGDDSAGAATGPGVTAGAAGTAPPRGGRRGGIFRSVIAAPPPPARSSDEPQFSMSALSLSPAPQKIGPAAAAYGFYGHHPHHDENVNNISEQGAGDGNVAAAATGKTAATVPSHNESVEHLMSYRRKAHALGPNDMNLPANDGGHGDDDEDRDDDEEDDDERIVKRGGMGIGGIGLLQTYPAMGSSSSPYAGFKSMDGYRYA